jgi:hypothetical protein
MKTNRTRTSLRAIGLLIVAAILLQAPLADAQEGSLTGELVKMLEAEISEEIILEWLESADRPQAISADDLVALKKAGASPVLMQGLLELSRESGTTAQPRTAAGSPPEVQPSASPTPAAAGDEASSVLVTVVLSYLSRVEEPDPEWDLYVYLDGMPVSYVSHQGMQNRPSTIEFAREVPPGKHTIRVTQERHERRRSGWEHWARTGDEEFVFELQPGRPARIEVDFHERILDYSDPLAFKLVQGSVVLDSGRVGGEAEFWLLVCEDIESSVPEGKEPSRAQRRQLEDCVRWNTLWEVAPSRAEVLEAMSKFDYRPLAKGS